MNFLNTIKNLFFSPLGIPLTLAISMFIAVLSPNLPAGLRGIIAEFAPWDIGLLALVASQYVLLRVWKPRKELAPFVIYPGLVLCMVLIIPFIGPGMHDLIWTNPFGMIFGAIPLFLFGISGGLVLMLERGELKD